jgi:YfiH family protein
MSAIAAIVPDWPAPSRVRGLATLRSSPGVSLPPFGRCNLGARGGDDPALVAANRAGLSAAFGLPSPPWWLHQVHGTGVLRVDAPASDAVPVDAEPQADAAVAGTPGVVLAVLSADCLPVLFAADDGSAVGAAHAGWRGLAAGVLERTVEALGVVPRRVFAWLGPAIGPANYEVGIEVRDAFLAVDPDASAAFAPTRPGHWTCDLYALARQRLARAGVVHVCGGGYDTFADPARFHSHRRDGARSGRQATLVWIDPSG